MWNWFRTGKNTKKEDNGQRVAEIPWIDEDLRIKVNEFSEKLGSRTHVAVRDWSDEVYDYMELRLKGTNWMIYYRVMGSDSEWCSGAYYISEFRLIPRAQWDALQDAFHEIHETVLALGSFKLGGNRWTLPKTTTKMALVADEYGSSRTQHILTLCNMYSNFALQDFIEELRIRQRLIKSTVTNKVVSPGNQLLVLDNIDKVLVKPSSKSVTVLGVSSLEQMLNKVPLDGTGVFLHDLIVQDNETQVVRHMDRARLIHPDTYKMLTTTLDGQEIFK